MTTRTGNLWLLAALVAPLVALCAAATAASAADSEPSDLGQVMAKAIETVSPAVVRVLVPEVRRPLSATLEDKPADEENNDGVKPEAEKAPAAAPAEKPKAKPDAAPAEKPKAEKTPEAAPPSTSEILQKTGKTHVRTGLLLSSDGYVITSLVNVGKAKNGFKVELADGRVLPAKRLGEDVQRDLALLKIEGKNFPAPEFARKSDLIIGQWVLAIGRTLPAGQPTVTKGIVSAVDRLAGVALQTDANISPMNYGGPLVDVRGRVVALIASVGAAGSSARAGELSDSGIGFAIPIDDVLADLPELKAGRRLEVPFLGIEFNMTRLGEGALVEKVFQATGAKAAGIKDGDIIVEFDGAKIASAFQLGHQIGRHKVGNQVSLKVIRGGQTLTLEATLKARPEYLRD